MSNTINILLVDDDFKNSMLLKRFLEVEGYCVTYANNGSIGWELYRTERPDLILLDVNMPEMNGFELAQRIRENKKLFGFYRLYVFYGLFGLFEVIFCTFILTVLANRPLFAASREYKSAQKFLSTKLEIKSKQLQIKRC